MLQLCQIVLNIKNTTIAKVQIDHVEPTIRYSQTTLFCITTTNTISNLSLPNQIHNQKNVIKHTTDAVELPLQPECLWLH